MVDEKKLVEELRHRRDREMIVCGDNTLLLSQIQEVVENQPKVGEWIPCSERLPENDGSYIICNDKGCVFTDHYYPPNNIHNGHFGMAKKTSIIAWQPLPEPYKAGEEE